MSGSAPCAACLCPFPRTHLCVLCRRPQAAYGRQGVRMSQSVFEAPAQTTLPPLLWVSYALLAASFLLMMLNALACLLAVAAVVIAYVLRKAQRTAGNEPAVCHATWQIRTFWLTLLLAALLILAVVVFAGIFGADDAAMQQAENISTAVQNGTLGIAEGLKQLWALPPLRNMVLGIMVMSVLLLWPLARVFKGGYALFRAKMPQDMGVLPTLISWVAALLLPCLLGMLL